jgi:hypothetical protein
MFNRKIMTEEEIKKYWRMSADHEEIHINQSALIMNLTNEIRDIDRKARGRDMLELAAAAVVAIFFSVRFYLTTSIQTKVGCGILVLGCIIIACKLLAAYNRRTGKQEDQSARTYLIHARKKVQNQIKLLSSVLYWYLLPLYLGLVNRYNLPPPEDGGLVLCLFLFSPTYIIKSIS